MSDKSKRVFNFSAGPSMLPVEVLEKVQSQMLCYNSTGQSVMEMSHRSKEYLQIYNQAEKDMRDILNIPAHYKILNLQGGATLQFSAIPLNLLGGEGSKKCDYAITGQWSEKSFAEAKKYGEPHAVLDTKNSKYTTIPDQSKWSVRPDAEYLYYCDNETVNGVEFQFVPDSNGIPLISDMSSNFMSRAIDIQRHAIIYAGVQKNLGPAGNTVVIVDDKYLTGKREHPLTPVYCSWETQFKAQSMYNTPSCFAIYVMGLYLEYTKEKGGVAYWEEMSKKKSDLLYSAIDDSDSFYSAPVHKSCRSRMNVPFIICGGIESLEMKFLDQATKAGFVNLAGHRSVGGLRASLYNGMPYEGVEKLVTFMSEFREVNSL
jgi:phosphoserine aminotransferase